MMLPVLSAGAFPNSIVMIRKPLPLDTDYQAAVEGSDASELGRQSARVVGTVVHEARF